MKKYLLSFCTVWMAAMTIAAAQPSRCGMRRAGSHTINFSGGMAIGGGDIDMLFGPFGYVEYARNVKGRFWAGGRLGVRYDCQSATCQPSYVPENYLRPALYGIGYWECTWAGI